MVVAIIALLHLARIVQRDRLVGHVHVVLVERIIRGIGNGTLQRPATTVENRRVGTELRHRELHLAATAGEDAQGVALCPYGIPIGRAHVDELIAGAAGVFFCLYGRKSYGNVLDRGVID